VFDDVAEVSSFLEPGHKAARTSQAAMMVLDSRKGFEESFVEAVELTALAFDKLAKVQPHEQHRTIAINIRTMQRANALDFHGLLAFQLHARQPCQFSCQQSVVESCVMRMLRTSKCIFDYRCDF
jgi:hypothetical protein